MISSGRFDEQIKDFKYRHEQTFFSILSVAVTVSWEFSTSFVQRILDSSIQQDYMKYQRILHANVVELWNLMIAVSAMSEEGMLL